MTAGLAHPLAFLGASLAVVVVPGPATLFVTAQAGRSTRHAALALSGIVAGDLALMTAAALGVAALLAQSPGLSHALRIAGALYVAWMGVQMLATPAGADPQAPAGGFRRGLLLTLGNPKPVLFFGAFFPLFLDTRAAPAPASFALLGAMFEAVNLAWFAAMVALVRLGDASFSRLPPGLLRKAGGLGLMACSAGVWLA